LELGWYIGGQLGTAKTAVSRNDIETTIAEQGIDGEIISLDTSGTSYHLFAGYQFNAYLGMQVDYIDWGDRTLGIAGGTNIGNLDDYYDAVARIHPDSGDAILVSAIYTLPLGHGFSVAAKVGLLSWESDYRTVVDSSTVGRDNLGGVELSTGVELHYRLRKDTVLFAAIDSVDLERQRMNSFGIGIRHYLAD
ncbi:MAG: outer membrane beta-barrel protein, partial [Gammaproteobacteria bacterium]|nr:outer membrane beta-barrel protein [Gammaproteobacteria bacterium]